MEAAGSSAPEEASMIRAFRSVAMDLFETLDVLHAFRHLLSHLCEESGGGMDPNGNH